METAGNQHNKEYTPINYPKKSTLRIEAGTMTGMKYIETIRKSLRKFRHALNGKMGNRLTESAMKSLALSATLFTCASVIFASSADAARKPPPQSPILRIEAGMHTTVINRVGVDEKCSTVVTGSDDKTVRLWEIPKKRGDHPRLIRTLRPPIGVGNIGKVYAVALSPDGRWVAAGGWDPDDSVYIFEASTGRLVRRLSGLGDVILHLVFSKNGGNLAATLGGGKGVRIWNSANWRLVGSDRNYNKLDSYGADFDRKGRLYTIAYDNRIRRYSTGFRLEMVSDEMDTNRPFSVSVNPVTDQLAVGYRSKPTVNVFNSLTFKHEFAADTKDIKNGEVSSVSWSRDGKHLFAGGEYDVDGRSQVRHWDQGGRGAARNIAGTRDTIMHIISCGQNILMSGADPAFGLLSPRGETLFWQDTVKPDQRGKRYEHFTISDDGLRVRFGLREWSGDAVMFDLANERLIDSPKPPADLNRADIKSLKIEGWVNSRNPKLNGTKLDLMRYEVARSLAIAPDKKNFVLGADWRIRGFNQAGSLQWSHQVPSVVWGVNIPKSGKILVAAYGDGTIRWHRLSDGKELLALFVQSASRRWVAWTPTGYYTASEGGEDLIGWHLNRGSWTEEAVFYKAHRFRDRFYRPDIIQLVLTTLDEKKAILEANKKSGRGVEDTGVIKKLPPLIKIKSPGNGADFSGETIKIEYATVSPSGDPIDKVYVHLNGRPIPREKGLAPKKSGDQGNNTNSIIVKVPPRDVNIQLFAKTGSFTSEPAQISLKWTGAKRAATPDYLKPKLYALVVGVSDYPDKDLKLSFAHKDAMDFANALNTQRGGLYRDVKVKLLTDSEATRANILEGLSWLEDEVTARDVGIVFMSGHGKSDRKRRFYFVPHDAVMDKIKSTGVKQSDIHDALTDLPGKVLMFLDACHSGDGISKVRTKGIGGAVDMINIINDLSSAENGLVMFSSSTGRELSVESDDWKNGAFTKAILEGFKGRADYNRDNAISIAELEVWISDRVKELTDKRQHPVARRPDTVPNFPFAMARTN